MARISKPPEERKQELIDAAFRLFCERGYEQTAVRDIVGEVGVAQGLFYYYFKNKESVFLAAAHQYGERLMDEVVRIITSAGHSPLQRIRQTLRKVTEVLYSSDAYWRRMPADLSTRMQIYFQQLTRDMLEPHLTELFRQGAELGQFTVERPLYTSPFLLAGFVGMSMEQGAPPAGEILSLFQHLLERVLELPQGVLTEEMAEE